MAITRVFRRVRRRVHRHRSAPLVALFLVVSALLPLPASAASATQISRLQANTNRPSLYSLYELDFDLSTAYSESDRFNPAVVDVRATFQLPTGVTERVPAFYKQDSSPHWAVRYSPRLAGAYAVSIDVVDPNGKSHAGGLSFIASAAADSAGFLRASGARIRTSNGGAFVIDGTNAAWATTRPDGSSDTDYSYVFDQMQQANMNFARVFGSAWWDKHAIEYAPSAWERGKPGAYGGLGRYSLNNAARADTIFANAAAHNIYLDWVLARTATSNTTGPSMPTTPPTAARAVTPNASLRLRKHKQPGGTTCAMRSRGGAHTARSAWSNFSTSLIRLSYTSSPPGSRSLPT
jgi:Domain of unknown function (DUF5060)